MERKTLFVDLVLPLPVKGYFTYRVPFELNDIIQPGVRVVVQFGKKKVYTALVRRVHENVPTYAAKFLLSILDDFPIVNEIQFRLWEWIASYYLCTPGEVMNIALPSALKLTSETLLVLNPDFSGDYSQLNENEFLVAEALEIQEVISITDTMKITGQAKVIPLIRNLIEKGVVLLQEEINDRFKPKLESFIRLSPNFAPDFALQKLMDELEKRAFKQLEFLMAYLQLAGQYYDSDPPEINKRKVMATIRTKNSSPLKALVEKNVFELSERIVSRLDSYSNDQLPSDITLSEAQEKALTEIETKFQTFPTKLIDKQLKAGKQVLYLLPEIALTSQVIKRLRRYFGDLVGVYHSKFNEQERVEIWKSVNSNSVKKDGLKDYPIVIGARSALFLPYNNLGLIIVDEEHDNSFKQFDPAPRYNARDSALVLANMHGAKTLLGSATPSLESFFNAKQGKYGFVQLMKRYGEVKMPEILVADLSKEYKQKSMHANFSSLLLNKMKEVLERGEQVILFRNRRGFSPRLECEDCNHSPECKNCDVTMVYHKHINLLKCHYCGYSTRVPATCPECGSKALKMKGFGTFPNVDAS